VDLITEDLFEKDIFFVFPDKELLTDPISDAEKPPITLIFSNFGIKIPENVLYIVTKNGINVYFGDLDKNIYFLENL